MVTALVSEASQILLLGILAVVFLQTWLVQLHRVNGDGMAPALVDSELLLVDRARYRGWSSLEVNAERLRGQVLVFGHPTKPGSLVAKRCVAAAGDTVGLVDKQLTVNGTLVAEDHYKVQSDDGTYPSSRVLEPSLRYRDNLAPFQLGEDQLFCLGDNRDGSIDSRTWGPIASDRVVGRAVLAMRSGDQQPWQRLIRWVR